MILLSEQVRLGGVTGSEVGLTYSSLSGGHVRQGRVLGLEVGRDRERLQRGMKRSRTTCAGRSQLLSDRGRVGSQLALHSLNPLSLVGRAGLALSALSGL